jgi:hypothetical protein
VSARRRPLPDDDVQLVVLERGVEFFLQHRLHAMNLVEEQHLALAEVGQDRRQVALDLQRRSRSLLEPYIQFVGNDGGERGLTQPGRTEEKYMIERLAARFRGLQGNLELLFGLRLANEFPQPSRPQLQLKILFFFSARSADQPVRRGPQDRVLVSGVIWRVVARDRHAEQKCSLCCQLGQNRPYPVTKS